MSVQINGVESSLVYGPEGVVTGCKIWRGSATTDANGAWTISYANAGFLSSPAVQAQAISTDATPANAAQATVAAPSVARTGCGGIVTVPATIAVGGLAVKAAGAGVVVQVTAVGA